MKKIFLLLFLLLFISTKVYAGTATRYFIYQTNSQVTAVNLNGNINNLQTVINGGLDNDNADTSSGFRFYEVLGSLPSAATQGRAVYLTTDDTMNFDNGSAFLKVIAPSGTPAQGNVVFHDGTDWSRLAVGTSGQFLKTQGASNDVVWASVAPIWKATNSLSLDLNGQGDVAFTDVDLTSVTSANATAVVCRVLLRNTTAGEYAVARFRKNGDTPTYGAEIRVTDAQGGDTGDVNIIIVACDTGEIIEYDIDTETSNTVVLQLAILGYWE